jgi:CBS domain-containing protein
MVKNHKPFLNLTAADLMSREVKTIPQTMSLRAAAHLLYREQISGVPVVDAEGRCVGVLSATDLVRWAGTSGRPDRTRCSAPVEVCLDWQMTGLAFVPEEEVSRHMTADPVTAAPDTPVAELARMMMEAHIHRILVADAEGHPVGIVTSTDVLAAVAFAQPGPGARKHDRPAGRVSDG